MLDGKGSVKHSGLFRSRPGGKTPAFYFELPIDTSSLVRDINEEENVISRTACSYKIPPCFPRLSRRFPFLIRGGLSLSTRYRRVLIR